LIVLLSAQTALGQTKTASEGLPAANGKTAAATSRELGRRVASNGDRAAESAVPAAKPAGASPTTPAQPAPPPAKKTGAPPVIPSPRRLPTVWPAGMLLPPVSVHPDGQYPTTARVAVTEFQVTGEDASRALAMRLQDGFVVGLTRTAAPIYVLDSVDGRALHRHLP